MRSLAFVAALAGAASADVAPDPEVAKVDVQVVLPTTPGFELVAVGDGAHGVKELHVAGATLLDTKVTVRGYITWIYDCVEALHTAKESKAETQKRIDDDPTLCERPKFYLGDRKDTSPDHALWVVDVPRLANKLERERMKKPDLDQMYPAERVPKIAVGDYVELTGDFKLSSPHADRNSDGLLVYGTLTHTTPSKTAGKAVARTEPALPTPPAMKPKAAKSVDEATKRQSIKQANEGTRALGAKQFDAAVEAYGKAVAAWDGNALAWYGLGAAHGQRGEWKDALDAFDHATAIAPDASMYQMWSGVAAYEAAVAQAREDQARAQNTKPENIKPVLSAVDFDRAADPLVRAIKLEPKLWRAQYYLGRIFRERGYPHLAAERLGLAITANPREPGPYVALAEIYRKWGYTTEAIEVASQGAGNVKSPSDASDLHYILGMAYDETQANDKAIDAFTKALDERNDNHKARFQRGQVYFRKGDYKNAKRDLEDFVKNAGPTMEFPKQQASKMLMDIAAKTP